MSILKITKKKFITFLIFFQWLLYENIFFLEPQEFFGNLSIIVFSLKLLIPFYIFYNSSFQVFFINKGKTSLYIFFFFLFICWSFIPTILYGNLFSWLKLIPVFVFFLGVTSFFYNNFNQVYFLFKMVIIYLFISLFDYLLISFFDFSFIGLINNRIQVNTIYLPNYSFSRLVGLWKEPSNASLISFISYFLSNYLYNINRNKFWRFSSYLCLSAGILCFSSAGYFAFSMALFYKYFFDKKSKGILKKTFYYSTSILFMFLILFSLFSRFYFQDNPTNNTLITLLSGNKNNNQNYDPSAGRVDRITFTIKNIKNNIAGYGIQTTGANGTLPVPGSASAPFFWLALTGVPGFILIIMRELTLFKMFKKVTIHDKNNLFLVQCLICVISQHLINGSLMDASYIIFSSLILINYKKSILKCAE
jgi:hypothetical protein